MPDGGPDDVSGGGPDNRQDRNDGGKDNATSSLPNTSNCRDTNMNTTPDSPNKVCCTMSDTTSMSGNSMQSLGSTKGKGLYTPHLQCIQENQIF